MFGKDYLDPSSAKPIATIGTLAFKLLMGAAPVIGCVLAEKATGQESMVDVVKEIYQDVKKTQQEQIEQKDE